MDNEKVDKGFQLIYWKLSYRRKFIRTVWFALFLPLLAFMPQAIKPFGLERVQVIILFALILILQAGYNYYMWKKTE